MEDIIKLLHRESCDVLFFDGVICENQEIIDIFENTQLAYYDITSKRLHITSDLIDYCIEASPKIHKFPVSPHSFGGGGIGAFIQQADDYINPDINIHSAEAFRIAEEFNIPFMFKPVSFNNRLEDAVQIDIMRKYYSGYIYVRVETKEGIGRAIEENEDNGNVCTTHSLINSPLKLNDVGFNLEIFKTCVRNNLPIYLTSMPVSCITGPATMYGLVLLAQAEFLFGMCLAQLLNPGVTVVNGAFPAAGNPSNSYQPALGSMFHNQCNYTLAKVSDYLGFPSCQSGGTTENKVHTPTECGTDFDTYKSYTMWNKLRSWHQVRHSFGFVNSLLVFDIYKMRRDCKTLKRVVENGEYYDDELEEIRYDKDAIDAINSGMEINNFKDLDHTLLNMGVLKEFLD